MTDHQKEILTDTFVGLFFLALLIGLIGTGMWGCPQYGVYSQRLTGQAELERAEFNRRILVQEAQAKMDSAKLLAQAEVERARGVAEANTIISEGLKGNEEYLRYLWIQNLESSSGGNQVIYIPTEAGLPILEAMRMKGDTN